MMKSRFWKTIVIGTLAWLAVSGATSTALAAENDPVGPGDRLQRLERRLNELAERQEQMMQRLSAPERQPEPLRPRQLVPPANARQQRAMPAVGPNPDPARRLQALGNLPVPGFPAPEVVKAHKGIHDLLGLVFLVAIICNILLAVWIFTDIRKRGEGSGIFIALALVAGIPTAIIYALVRIGDRKAQTTPA